MQELTAKEADMLEEREKRKAVVKHLLSELNRLLDKITEREARILKLRFGLEGGHRHTLQEIGNIFHVTKERVLRIEERALYKLGWEL